MDLARTLIKPLIFVVVIAKDLACRTWVAGLVIVLGTFAILILSHDEQIAVKSHLGMIPIRGGLSIIVYFFSIFTISLVFLLIELVRSTEQRQAYSRPGSLSDIGGAAEGFSRALITKWLDVERSE
jgi:hypothetical protein